MSVLREIEKALGLEQPNAPTAPAHICAKCNGCGTLLGSDVGYAYGQTVSMRSFRCSCGHTWRVREVIVHPTP